MSLRLVAVKTLLMVLQGKSLSKALLQNQSKLQDPRDIAFLQAISFGICRRYFYLQEIVHQLLEKPFKEKDDDLYCLLLVGIYQLQEMRVPPHAAISETVNVVSELKKDWAKGLVNAVLRNFQRQQADFQTVPQEYQEAFYDHPEWIIEELKQDWPEDWSKILTANNEHPPLALRVNTQYGSREAYLNLLNEQNIEAKIIPETSEGIIVDESNHVHELPLFKEGAFSVQDGSASFAAHLLDLEPECRVLDACAAPGGKTTHIMELCPSAKLVAVDKKPERLKTVKENFKRLQLPEIELKAADIADRDAWWDGELFDRILLDAPCSASGVIRRHPDIKLLRRESDLETLVNEQFRLLETVWSTLKVGGILVYATCSVFKKENTNLIEDFLKRYHDAEEVQISLNVGLKMARGIQILPGMHGLDGFYYACLKKLS